MMTFGFAIVFIGVEGRQIVPAIIGSGVLVGVRCSGRSPAANSPATRSSLLVVPGRALAGLVLAGLGAPGGRPTHLAVVTARRASRASARPAPVAARIRGYNPAGLRPAPAERCPSWPKEHDWKSCRRC